MQGKPEMQLHKQAPMTPNIAKLPPLTYFFDIQVTVSSQKGLCAYSADSSKKWLQSSTHSTHVHHHSIDTAVSLADVDVYDAARPATAKAVA